VGLGLSGEPSKEDCDLAHRGAFGVPQALRSQLAGSAVALRAGELDRFKSIDVTVPAVSVETLARRADGVTQIFGDPEVRRLI
jgi:hypothetical protein